MKLIPMYLAMAASIDQQPPTIGLDLAQSILRTDAGVPMTAKSDLTGHAMVCEVGVAAKDCALPVAHAYDHHDGLIDDRLVKKFYIVMSNEKGVAAPQWTKKAKIDYNLRAEWVVEHTACDTSGNCADPLKFTVILRDTVAPVLRANVPKTIETKSIGSMYTFSHGSATDNYDGEVPVTIKPVSIPIFKVGTKTVTYSAHDYAGVFGVNGKNNAVSKTYTVKIVDNTVSHVAL